MTTVTSLSIEEWNKQYRPITNHLDNRASWEGVMFETYGDEVDYVYAQDSAYVWTYVDGDDGTYLISGRAFINRIGYFICEVPVPDDQYIEIQVIANDEDEADDL